MNRSNWWCTGLLAVCVSVSAIGYSHAADISEKARAQANDLYESRCESCHGEQGHGDGPGAIALGAKPANFNSKKFQGGVTDKQIATAIVQGGAAVGLSQEMQPNPDLANRPEVVQALVAKVRQFGK